jgi:serine/threonine protein kinase
MEDVHLRVGDVLRRRYEIQELLRNACDKKVYRAYDRELDHPVALDVFSNNPIMPNGLRVSAWEARVLARLGDDPNIATVIDRWDQDGTAVMVTRYLPGGSLSDLIVRSYESGKGLPVEDILRISIEIACGLSYIHRRRILYRDLQPRNVLFDEWGTVHLVDFDTAVLLDDQDVSDLSHRPMIDYMAPELADGGDTDERADLYSLGATVYEMCCGRPPYTGSREEILTASWAGPSPSLERDDLPGALRDLVFRLLARDRDQRPASAADVVGYLEGIRTAHADLERLLASNIDGELLKTLVALLNQDYRMLVRSPSESVQFGPGFSNEQPEFELSSDHRLLMLAIMALAEAEYRRAAIDSAAAAETAVAWAISDELRAKGLNPEYIDQTIRNASGLTRLIKLYSSFGHELPVPVDMVVNRLANVRNKAAHKGWAPSPEVAARAVELAHDLVKAVHPFLWEKQ